MAVVKSYAAQRDREIVVKLAEIIDSDLPPFCREYFIGIESRTTALTRLNYVYDLRTFFNYLTTERTPFAGVEVKKITLERLQELPAFDIEKYLSYLTYYTDADGAVYTNADKSKARKLSTVRAMFKYFMKKEKINRDPTISVAMPKLHDKEIIRLEKGEAALLLKTAESGRGLSAHQRIYHRNTALRDAAIVGLFLGTGIRVSELVGIDVVDIDFNENSFVVTRKGGNRTVLYFSDEIGALLQDYAQLRQANAADYPKERAFFLSLQNRRITTRSVENVIKKYAFIAAPLKKISPHKLRSTFGTELYRKTGDIYMVADVLGHKDVNTTKKHYAAISEDSKRKAASKIKILTSSDEDIDK